MAFFNLTYLGPQDPIKNTCISKTEKNQTVEEKPVGTSPTVAASSQAQVTNGNAKPVDPSRERHGGSYVKHTELMYKHTRHPLGECEES